MGIKKINFVEKLYLTLAIIFFTSFFIIFASAAGPSLFGSNTVYAKSSLDEINDKGIKYYYTLVENKSSKKAVFRILSLDETCDCPRCKGGSKIAWSKRVLQTRKYFMKHNRQKAFKDPRCDEHHQLLEIISYKVPVMLKPGKYLVEIWFDRNKKPAKLEIELTKDTLENHIGPVIIEIND